MIHHYMTNEQVGNELIVRSWLQINFPWYHVSFSRKEQCFDGGDEELKPIKGFAVSR